MWQGVGKSGMAVGQRIAGAASDGHAVKAARVARFAAAVRVAKLARFPGLPGWQWLPTIEVARDCERG